MIAASTEADITELDSYEERQMFLEDMGLNEPGVSKLIRSAYKLLNLSTFFTAGVKEVRAWTIKEGMKAPQAAGVIHTDFEKGFIRAEVIKFTDFVELGSELACKENGKYVGICGQGPSDDPDFAHWLMDKGISSLSLNPDTIIDTWKKLEQ